MNNFDYLKVPKKINLRDISENKYNLSSRNYKKITFSNSTEKVYQLYLGPIKGKANAKQWSKLIEVENILLSY